MNPKGGIPFARQHARPYLVAAAAVRPPCSSRNRGAPFWQGAPSLAAGEVTELLLVSRCRGLEKPGLAGTITCGSSRALGGKRHHGA